MTVIERPGESATQRIRPWRDTREWIERVDAIGELRVVHGVDWQDGIGEVTELLDHTEGSPAVLFDDIPGYPSGYRVLVNCQRHACVARRSPCH